MDVLYKKYFIELNEIYSFIFRILKLRNNLLTEIVQYSSFGKRIRSLIIIIINNAFEKKDQYICLASAIELIHLATLIHDDIIDRGVLRHSKYCSYIAFGTRMSVLVGDFLFIEAFKLIAESNFPELIKITMQSVLNIIIGVIEEIKYRRKIISLNIYYYIILYKTAELFGISCKISAIINKCSDDIIDVLYKFGIVLGIMFQITDDVLDYNIENNLGKEVGNDFKESNVTLPIILLFYYANTKEQKRIEEIFYISKKNIEDYFYIKTLLLKYDILQKIYNILTIYYQKALILLNLVFSKDLEAYNYLKIILDYCFYRC